MMKILIIAGALLSLPITLNAKPWRGITPLHSKVADVEVILGKPSNTSHYWSTYQTETEAVSILYSNGLSCRSGANSHWRVPTGTVVSITVAPKSIIRFSTLGLNQSSFRIIKDPHKLNHIEYWNDQEGESISVVDDEISSFTYTASNNDSYLRCPSAQTPKIQAEVTYKLDTYGNLKFRDEAIRLDNLAIELADQPQSKGYIVVYSGTSTVASNARARAKRAKDYLIKVRRIKPVRLVALYGGRRPELIVEMYIVPRGAEAPIPFAASFVRP